LGHGDIRKKRHEVVGSSPACGRIVTLAQLGEHEASQSAHLQHPLVGPYRK